MFFSGFSVRTVRTRQGHRFNNVAETKIWPEFCDICTVCKCCTFIVKLLCYYCHGNDCAIFLLVLFTVMNYTLILEMPILLLKLCSKLGHPIPSGDHWGHNKEQGIHAAIVPPNCKTVKRWGANYSAWLNWDKHKTAEVTGLDMTCEPGAVNNVIDLIKQDSTRVPQDT